MAPSSPRNSSGAISSKDVGQERNLEVGRQLVGNLVAEDQPRRGCELWVAEKGHGDLFIEDVTLKCWHFHGGNVWARQINPEGGYTNWPATPPRRKSASASTWMVPASATHKPESAFSTTC